jgi:hypothetical protein
MLPVSHIVEILLKHLEALAEHIKRGKIFKHLCAHSELTKPAQVRAKYKKLILDTIVWSKKPSHCLLSL